MPAAKGARRQHRVTISDDMGAVWDWFKEVPPKAAPGEIDFLLRLGVLAAAGVRRGGGQAGHGADQPALPLTTSPASGSVASAPRADAQLEETTVEDGAVRVEKADGWNFLGGGFEASGAGG